MTNQKLKEIAIAIITEATDDPDFRRKVLAAPANYTEWKCIPVSVAGAAAILADCLNAEAAAGKPAGRKEAQSIIKRLAKKFSTRNIGRELQGIFEDAGKYWLCDGCELIGFSEDVPGAVHAEKVHDPLKTASAIGERSRYDVTLKIPTVPQIKAYIDAYKATFMAGKRSKTKEAATMPLQAKGIKEKYVWCDPARLLDIVRLYPYSVASCYNPINPIYFAPAAENPLGDDAEALLMPMRADKNEQAAAKKLEMAAEIFGWDDAPAAEAEAMPEAAPAAPSDFECSLMQAGRRYRRLKKEGCSVVYAPDEFGVLWPLD